VPLKSNSEEYYSGRGRKEKRRRRRGGVDPVHEYRTKRRMQLL
jgi:hypothetical protein